MKGSETYTWEAQYADGSLLTQGEFLADCVRFSFLPQVSPLPRHDIVGVKMIRRFNRGFQKSFFGSDALPGLFFWEDGSSCLVSELDMAEFIQPGELVGKGVDGEDWYLVQGVVGKTIVLDRPYRGHSKPRGMQAKKRCLQHHFQYLYCVVCEGFRAYVNGLTGALVVTPYDYELYL